MILEKLALCALAGVLNFVGYIGFDQFYLMWFAQVPVLWAVRDLSPRRALLFGIFFGFISNAGGYYWVIQLIHQFGKLSWFLSTAIFCLLCLQQSFVQAVPLALVRRANLAFGLAPVLSLPLLYTAWEWMFPLLFPYYIGYSQYRFTPINQIVEITGLLGLTAVIMAVNGGFYELVAAKLEARKTVRPRVLGPAALFAFVLIFGLVRLTSVDEKSQAADPIKVALIQTNIGAKDKSEKRGEFLRRHVEMSKAALLEHPDLDLIVWPESAYNRRLPRENADVSEVVQVPVPLIFGAITHELVDNKPRIYNSAVLAGKDGKVLSIFDKVELLAFGETLPFARTFPEIRKLRFGRQSWFTHGTRFLPLTMEDGTRLLPMVCYEDIIPSFVRSMWKIGGPSHVLVNVTNDSWYGDSHEPIQHLAMAAYRSIETRRALIRSTNTGISALVDPAGRIVARTGQWTAESLVGSVPLIKDESTTIYQRAGDWLGYVMVAAIVFGYSVLNRRAHPRTR